MGITISTDLNYRAKLWKYGGDREKIMTELTSYCDIILGNEEDAEMHFGIKPEGLDITTQGEHVKAEAFRSVCEQMQAKFPRAKRLSRHFCGNLFLLLPTLGQGFYMTEKPCMKVHNIKSPISLIE